MYDLIIVPANGFTKNWELPPQVIKRLELVAKLYQEGAAPKVALPGKWSIVWDVHAHIKPPVTEAQLMRNELISLGVHKNDIFIEEKSQDTIGNAYFVKKLIVEPHKFKKLLVICEDFHLKRCKFLFKKIIPDCEIGFMTSSTKDGQDAEFMKIEENVYATQEKFLASMKPGDDSYLQKRLYGDQYYQGHRDLGRAGRIAMGSFV